jgi:hypothetical protein
MSIVWISLIPWSAIASREWVPHSRLHSHRLFMRIIVSATLSWPWPLSLHVSLYFFIRQVTWHLKVIFLFKLFFWHHSFHVCHRVMCTCLSVLVFIRCLYMFRNTVDDLWCILLDVRWEIDSTSHFCAHCHSAYTFRWIIFRLTQLIVQHIIQVFLTIIFFIERIIVRHSFWFYSLVSLTTIEVLAKSVVVGRACVHVRNLTEIWALWTNHWLSGHVIQSLVRWRCEPFIGTWIAASIIEHGATRHFAILHREQVGNVLQRVTFPTIVHRVHVALANPTVYAVWVVRIRVPAIPEMWICISIAIVLGHDVVLLVHWVAHSIPVFSPIFFWLRRDVVEHVRKITFVVHIETY